MIRIAAILALWAAALWGALALRHAPGDWGHSVCGPWGCGPPAQALLAIHLAWLLLLLPPSVATAASSRVPRPAKRLVAGCLATSGVVALVGVIGYQLLVWLPQASQYARGYLFQRCLFAVVTTIDFPALQTLAIGVWMLERLRRTDSAATRLA